MDILGRSYMLTLLGVKGLSDNESQTECQSLSTRSFSCQGYQYE